MTSELDLVLEQVRLPFDGEPHDYQVEDFVSATSVGSFGFYLDLGLGKTFTSIITACYHLIVGNYDRCIIICPESLITQWVLTLQAMGLDCLEYRGTPKKRSMMVFDKDFSIMSYQIFQKDYERIPKDGVYLIVDEATIMCNSQNILFKMVNGGEVRKKVKIPGRLRPKIEVREFQGLKDYGTALLTATPINNPQDAYGLIKTITPDVYRNYSQFERIHVAEYDYFDQPKEYQELDLLRENLLLQASMRSAGDYIDLPDIVIKTIKYNLSPGHVKVYDQLIDERLVELDGEVVVDALQATALYHWAQRFIINPEVAGYQKEPIGIDILDGVVREADNFLIFGNYKISNIKFMERYDIGGVSGVVTKAKQKMAIKDFKAGKLRGLACHPKSGGYGHDFPNCHHVVFPELAVTPRDLRQSVGRVYRQGQKHTVIVVAMVALGTIQESIFDRLLSKDDLVSGILNQKDVLSETMADDVFMSGNKTVEEVRNILKGIC